MLLPRAAVASAAPYQRQSRRVDRQKDDLATTVLGLTNNTGVDRIVEVELAGNLPLDEKIRAENGTICSFGAALTPKLEISMSGRFQPPRRFRWCSSFIRVAVAWPSSNGCAITLMFADLST